jgi:hypothetical protein
MDHALLQLLLLLPALPPHQVQQSGPRWELGSDKIKMIGRK